MSLGRQSAEEGGLDAGAWIVKWSDKAVTWFSYDLQGVASAADTRAHAVEIAMEHAGRPLTFKWNADFSEGVGR